MKSLRVAAGLTLILTIVLLPACAGGPPPNLSGPEGDAIRAGYTGSWVLIPEESESFQDKMDEALEGRGSGMRPGGGRRGGGGGMRGGGMRAGMDPEEIQRAMEETRRITATPRTIGISLTETTATLIQEPAAPMALTLGAEPLSHVEGQSEVRTSAEWTRNGLEIHREIPNVLGILDTYSVGEEGRLRLRRDVRMMRGQLDIRVRALYRKEGSES